MNYTQTEKWILEKLPMFQHSGSSAYKKDLDNIRELTEMLGNPQNKFKTIHIAGTNGKGSCSHMLASILQEAGYKTGLNTSPHLKDFRERIRINGEMCSKNYVIEFTKKYAKGIEKVEASFFEVSTAMAFDYFNKKKVDIAIIETGLGGRLDATNIIHPVLSIITNIGLEHTAILGDTLEKIAGEKAGIIKPDTPVIIGESLPETYPVFIKKAKECQSKITFAEKLNFSDYDSDLKGSYQVKNRKTVLAAVEELRKLGFKISGKNITNGLKNVIPNTGLRGRWDILNMHPLTVADTAHNPDGIRETTQQIKKTKHNQLHLVLGFVSDKDILSILKLFPQNANYYFCQPDMPRKFKVEDLKKIIPQNLNAKYFNSTREALSSAKSAAKENDLIYIGGSTFVVAEVL